VHFRPLFFLSNVIFQVLPVDSQQRFLFRSGTVGEQFGEGKTICSLQRLFVVYPPVLIKKRSPRSTFTFNEACVIFLDVCSFLAALLAFSGYREIQSQV
jgi:hypothetical protein